MPTLPFKLITKTNIEAHPDISHDHPCAELAQQMAEVHNSLIRLGNAAFTQATQIQSNTTEATDFLTWNKLIVDLIHEHHRGEEEDMFPGLEKLANRPGILSQNLEQHHAFEEPLQNLGDYVTKTSGANYDGMKLRSLWEALAPSLQKHLEEEPDTFWQLKGTDIEPFRKFLKDFEKSIESKTDPFT